MYEDARGKRCERHARKGSLFCDVHDPSSGGGWKQVASGLTKAAAVVSALLELKDVIEKLIKIFGGMHDKQRPAARALDDMQRRIEAVLLAAQSLPGDDSDSADLALAIEHFNALKADFAEWDRKNGAAFRDRDLVTSDNE